VTGREHPIATLEIAARELEPEAPAGAGDQDAPKIARRAQRGPLGARATQRAGRDAPCVGIASAPGPAVTAVTGGRACVGMRSSVGGSAGRATAGGTRTGRGTVSEAAAGIRAGGGMAVSTVRGVGVA